eukprot:3493277-Amphidinium_carterae.1
MAHESVLWIPGGPAILKDFFPAAKHKWLQLTDPRPGYKGQKSSFPQIAALRYKKLARAVCGAESIQHLWGFGGG